MSLEPGSYKSQRVAGQLTTGAADATTGEKDKHPGVLLIRMTSNVELLQSLSQEIQTNENATKANADYLNFYIKETL